MSSAACQARALGKLVEQRKAHGQVLNGLWQDYFPEMFEVTRAPWLFAALADFARPKCTGDFPTEEQPIVRLLSELTQRADQGDSEAARLVRDVGSMRRPLSALQEAST